MASMNCAFSAALDIESTSLSAVILLTGGDKSSQTKDIGKAKELAQQLEV